jgi:isoleucyl-tRNA synthetase
MPFAQHHYPFENGDKFKAQFPADFISEAVDQTRGWFYSLMAISTLLFDCSPYRNVIVLGHVQDENGQKMSKSKGNAVDPFEALETFGADAIRWYFYTNSAPWLPSRFSAKAVMEGQRKFLGTLWNTYAFYVLYADIDSFDPTKYSLGDCALTVMDRYALSVVNTAVKTVDAHLGNYRIPEAAAALYDCVDELSNWYVRRCRERYWGTEMTEDKVAAYMTLWTALVTVAKIAAPFVPFMADEIYRNLVTSVDPSAPESVHLCVWPEVEEDRIDAELEASMKAVVDVVVLGRAARNGANLKNRQPLAALYANGTRTLDATYSDIIRDELNVKEVKFVDDMSALSSYSFKPNLKTVGPKYGKLLGKIRGTLQAEDFDGNAAMAELKKDGALKLEFDGTPVSLGEDDLLIEGKQKPGYFTVSENGVSVALDTNLTDALIAEGFVREVISKVQTMRKEADFVVTDHIRVSVSGSEKLKALLQSDAGELCSATLCDELTFDPLAGEGVYEKEWDINGEKAAVGVARV